MKRKAGYYWVKVKNDGTTGVEGNIRAGWRIAKYLSFEKQEEWEIVGSTVSESVLCEINETRIPSPDEEIDLRDDMYIPDQYEEAFTKRIRSIADHCEFGLEFKNEVNGKYFDVDKDLLDKI